MRNLDLDLLRTLVTIEKANTFSGAANELFKTQSAVTQQMQRLESLIGFPLFEKKGRRRVLTPQGSKLAGYGRRLLAINDEALRTIGQQPMEGDVRLGAPQDVADTILPSALTHIARYAPKVRLEIRVDRSPFLMSALESGDLDLTISTRYQKNLNGIILRTSPTAWLCAADYVHNKRAPVPLILADEPSIFRKTALMALEQTKLEWHINYLAPTLIGIKAAVRAGLGITARSVELLEADMRVLGESDGLPPLAPVSYYLWTRKDTISPLTLHVYEILKRKFEDKMESAP
ncbi:LysR substrate-binding domain-containing protein [Paralcaligenes sp. KSB-10]|uniref:LysR substrate-binding domain-containing protein n=1 Tax=Paralcaligenes sp. KSB-10 TaxID=2901142 RepID=UPI001E3959F3|nr:LysR substrate-binding domain-containing protein [Paralcaligenes sp. KSB-10]UHL64019.1 LysR substrate-binding domain-containing protein [Paralcaligenes sp. KSB-10]